MKTTYFFKNLREGSKQGTLFFLIRKSNPKIRILVSTQTTADVLMWESITHGPKNPDLTPYGRRIIPRLDAAFSAAVALINREITDKGEIKKAVFKAVNPIAAERAEEAKEEEEREQKKKIEEEQRKIESEANDVVLCCQRFIEGISSGSIRYSKKNIVTVYSPASVKRWKSFARLLEEYHDENPFTWSDIDEKFVIKWTDYLESKGYLMMTVAKASACLHRLIAYYCGPIVAKPVQKSYCVDAELKRPEVYLTTSEIDALYSLPLLGSEEQVRDVFMIGLFTAQRFSDYTRLKKESFGTTAKGTKVIRIRQSKTNNIVVIPVLDSRLVALCKKYDYNVPSIDGVVFNRTLKQICRRLSESVPSLKEMIPSTLSLPERKAEAAAKAKGLQLFPYDAEGRPLRAKYNCISSHTARRSAITNMYLSGKYTVLQMMSVSGHLTEREFFGYVKLSADERADEVAVASNDGLF